MSLLLIHLAATWALVGLIWFVQLVHYPLFSAVAPERFVVFEAEHSKRTTWVVAVLMPAEAITGMALALNPPAGVAPVAGVESVSGPYPELTRIVHADSDATDIIERVPYENVLHSSGRGCEIVHSDSRNRLCRH